MYQYVKKILDNEIKLYCILKKMCNILMFLVQVRSLRSSLKTLKWKLMALWIQQTENCSFTPVTTSLFQYFSVYSVYGIELHQQSEVIVFLKFMKLTEHMVSRWVEVNVNFFKLLIPYRFIIFIYKYFKEKR